MIGKRDNMNKKGQALVEFILILPVLLLIAMAMIDIGNIFLKKFDLNNDLETVTELYKNNDTKQLGVYLANENLTLEDETVYKLKIDPVYLQNSKNAIIGSIINIENITEIVKLENMRRDFVANVSHELKTPLTSINGFVETLIMNEDLQVSKRNRFLAIIQKESDRLKRLIEDILLLSSIENKNDLVKESISLYDVFKEVYDMINYIASSKNIDLSYILLETDSPYLSPEPYRGSENNPSNIPVIAESIASIKGVTNIDVARVTHANAEEVFEFL